MPNHVHGILIINAVGQRHAFADSDDNKKRKYQLLPTIVGSYKSAVTKKINSVIRKKSFQWQTSYYDHIIRNEYSLNRIRQYIWDNPVTWEYDRNNENCLENANQEQIFDS